MRIKDKTPHPSVLKEAICRNCGATVEFVSNDVKERKWKDYTGEQCGGEYIECPNYNKNIIRGW